MNLQLYQLESTLKKLLIVYVVLLILGVTVGIIYLGYTTSFTPKGTTERFQGSEESNDDGFEIQEHYPKPISEMLITTHNHILGLGFVFFSVGIIFYFNSYIKGGVKTFLMIEPLISVLLTFGSIWLVRYVDRNFIYLTFLSSVTMYLSFYFTSSVVLYELLFKKN